MDIGSIHKTRETLPYRLKKVTWSSADPPHRVSWGEWARNEKKYWKYFSWSIWIHMDMNTHTHSCKPISMVFCGVPCKALQKRQRATTEEIINCSIMLSCVFIIIHDEWYSVDKKLIEYTIILSKFNNHIEWWTNLGSVQLLVNCGRFIQNDQKWIMYIRLNVLWLDGGKANDGYNNQIIIL